MRTIEVYADVACPFTYVALRHVRSHRQASGGAEPVLLVHPWPLELVNGVPHDASHMAAEIAAIRSSVAPDLFAGFSEATFPRTTVEALASEVAAHRVSADLGERFSFEVRDAVFERGLDVGDPEVLAAVRAEVGAPEPTDDDRAAVRASLDEGKARGVEGSPHFFTPDGDFFCPSLDISNDHGRFQVAFDEEGYRRFIEAAFGEG